MKVVDNCGFEIEIPSPSRENQSSWVLICRGISKFLSELHRQGRNHNVRSSELLKERGEAEGIARLSAETSSTEETRAKSFRNPLEPICFWKEIIPVNERKWISIPVNTSLRKDDLSALICKMAMRMMRHRDQDERDNDGAVHWDTMIPKLLRAFGDTGARDFLHKDLLQHIHLGCDKTRFEY